MNLSALPLSFLALFLYAVPVLAEEPSRPPFYQNAIEKAELRKAQLEARDALFQDFQQGRQDFLGTTKEEWHALLASSTPEERRALLEQRKEERHALFLEQQQERHEFFVENRGARLELIQEQWQERKEWFSSTTDWKANLPESVKRSAENRADALAALFARMLEHLSSIADRIEGRIALLEADGVDVTEAAAQLDEADVEIAEAADAVDELLAALEEALSSEDPKTALEDVASLKDAAKLAIREARTALFEAVAALPEAEEEIE